MIHVTRLDGKNYIINALLIETIEETPDTIITLTNGKRYIVKQSADEVVKQHEKFVARTHTFYYSHDSEK